MKIIKLNYVCWVWLLHLIPAKRDGDTHKKLPHTVLHEKFQFPERGGGEYSRVSSEMNSGVGGKLGLPIWRRRDSGWAWKWTRGGKLGLPTLWGGRGRYSVLDQMHDPWKVQFRGRGVSPTQTRGVLTFSPTRSSLASQIVCRTLRVWINTKWATTAFL